MDYHISRCFGEYRRQFSAEEDLPIDELDSEIEYTYAEEQFELFFFIEMNSSIFSGEYLYDEYEQKVEEFIKAVGTSYTPL